mmetsp:Transcript_3973/g.12529  ORF Transcript_3973/g.12529 Transcript_3973/m.12529 type:complete len:200 (-) Transcript_3973:25-624(-)
MAQAEDEETFILTAEESALLQELEGSLAMQPSPGHEQREVPSFVPEDLQASLQALDALVSSFLPQPSAPAPARSDVPDDDPAELQQTDQRPAQPAAADQPPAPPAPPPPGRAAMELIQATTTLLPLESLAPIAAAQDKTRSTLEDTLDTMRSFNLKSRQLLDGDVGDRLSLQIRVSSRLGDQALARAGACRLAERSTAC